MISQRYFQLAALMLLLGGLSAAGQTPRSVKTAPVKPAQKESAALPYWKIELASADPPYVTLQAHEAPLPRLAEALAQKLRVPITVSPSLRAQRISLELETVPLDAVLRMLAPLAYADMEVRGVGAPRWLAIYLQAPFDAVPAPQSSRTMQSLLIEGDTEGGTDVASASQPDEEPPLSLTIENQLITLRAKQQPLTVVAFHLAQQLNIPFELRYTSAELVNLSASSLRTDELVKLLPSSLVLTQRVKLQTNEAQPLRLILEEAKR